MILVFDYFEFEFKLILMDIYGWKIDSAKFRDLIDGKTGFVEVAISFCGLICSCSYLSELSRHY